VIAVPQAAIDLAKRFEGFHRVPRVDPGRAHPYVCPAGYWTIGYGHLCDPKHPPITEAEAEGYLATDLMTELNATLLAMHRTRVETPGQRQLLAAQLRSLMAHVDELRREVEFEP
jgi:GH24 family phage-related lysozyme (muramidase)